MPDKKYKAYDIYVHDWDGERKHFVGHGFTPRPEQIWKYSIEEFIESIYHAVDNTDDLDISLFAKVIIRFSDAAKIIQKNGDTTT